MLNLLFTDYPGNKNDLVFLENDNWLEDTLVNYSLYIQNGRWKIKFHFSWVYYPFRLLCKYFKEDYESHKKAALMADYYYKTIAKDKKEITSVKKYDYNICYN